MSKDAMGKDSMKQRRDDKVTVSRSRPLCGFAPLGEPRWFHRVAHKNVTSPS